MFFRNSNIVVVIALTLILLSLWFFFSPNSGIKYMKIKEDINSLNQEMAELKAHNKLLRNDIEKLKTNKFYLEDVARKEYGFLKKNEVVFDFSKDKKTK